MPLIKRLEQSILNALIRYVYALKEDEKAALLCTLEEISYQVQYESASGKILPYKNFARFLPARVKIAELPRETATASLRNVSLIVRLKRSIRNIFRRREAILQEEEELALFSTIEEISRQVHREAIECGILRDMADGGHFATDNEQVNKGTTKAVVATEHTKSTVRRRKSDAARQCWATVDMYFEFMEDISGPKILENRIRDRHKFTFM